MHGFHFLVWLFLVRTFRDTQCGFKMLTRSAASKLFKIMHVERWLVYLVNLFYKFLKLIFIFKGLLMLNYYIWLNDFAFLLLKLQSIGPKLMDQNLHPSGLGLKWAQICF